MQYMRIHMYIIHVYIQYIRIYEYIIHIHIYVL